MSQPARSTITLARSISGGGVPVVLLHGLTFDRSSWRPIVARLGDRVRSIAFDLPGHGESGGLPMSMEPLAALIRGQLDDVGVDRPVIVGHSMFGGLALAYAATQPARGAVTVEGPPDLRPFARLVRQLEPALRGEAFTDTFRRVFQPTMGLDRVPADVRARVLAGQRIGQNLVLGYWAELLETDPEVLQSRVDRLVGAVHVPVLGVFGHELAPPDRERLLGIPGAQVEQWPGRGHFVHLAEPDRFAQRLLTFVGHCQATGKPAPIGVVGR